MNATTQLTTSAIHSSFGLYGFCIAGFLVAALLRARLIPALHAGSRKLSSGKIGSKVSILGTVSAFVSEWTGFGLAVVAVVLFVLAGIAATATFLSDWFTWVADHIVGPVMQWLFHFAHWNVSTAAAGEWTVAIVGLLVFFTLLAEVLHGRVHKGEKDMLIFFSPLLLTHVPGDVSRYSADVFNWIATTCGPITGHWF